MPYDRKFDPETQDFIPNGRGGYERTPNADTSVMNQVLARRGKFWGDPDLGTLENGLEDIEFDPARDGVQAFKRGLGRLEALGRIRNLEVTAAQPAPGKVRIDTRFQDTSTSQVVTARVKSGG